MKTNLYVLTVLAATALAVAGCSKQGGESTTPPPAAAASVDTSKLVAAFQNADPAAERAEAVAVAAIQRGDDSSALKQLQALVDKYKLTDEQKAAVKDVIAKLQKATANAAAQSASEAGKAVTNMVNEIKQ